MGLRCMEYASVSVVVFASISNIIAMEVEEQIEVKIASNHLFRCKMDENYIYRTMDYQDNHFRNGKFDFKRLGCKSSNPTYKQFEYEFTLSKLRNEYTLMGLPFKPREFWEKHIDDQLLYLKDAIQEFDLLTEAPKHHEKLDYIGIKKNVICGRPGSYSKDLEEKFEVAVWHILSKDYKISLEEFTASLRSALDPGDKIYKAPLLMHFTNYLVPRYEFYYKNKSDEPYKTLKYPSLFEVAIGTPDVGAVVYEAK